MRDRKPTRGAQLLFALALAVQAFAAGAPASAVCAQDDARHSAAETFIAAGAAALERGDDAAARAAFQQALQTDPNNVDAHTYLGVLADRADDLREAERHFAAAAIAAPFNASARNNYGAILVRLNRPQLAAAQFEASLKLDPDQPNALVNLAQIRFNSGQPSDMRAARELFAHALRVAPDAEIARALVVIALRLGEKEQAAAAYRDYAARVATGTQAAQPNAAAADTAPSSAAAASAAARAELGQALLEAGLIEEARAELRAAAALDPANVELIVALARAQLKQKDIKAAGRTLEGAVARGLDAAPIYAALADVYEAGGYVEHAIPAMRLALARDPHNETYHFRYGLLLTDTGAPAAAIIRLQEALKEFPRSARLWLALGIAQLTDGKNAEAEQSFTRALEFDAKLLPALAYLGTTYAERGQYAQAVSLYERAIALDDREAVVYYLAADTMLNLPNADTAKAEKYLTRAIQLDPTLASARVALAKLYVRAERFAEAAAQLERAIQLAPDLTEAHYQLGRVYVRLKRNAEAQQELARFKEQSEAAKTEREQARRELVRRLANVRF